MILVIVLLLVIAAVAVALWWTRSGAKATVPGVVGQSRAAAVKALEKQGFKAGIRAEYSDRVAAGFVSRQSPPAGTRLREGDTVDIWVSKGSETVKLESLKGLTAAEVDDYLTRNDLQGALKKGKNGSVGEGEVYRQDPPAGTDVKRGDTVTYWVSTGVPQATVPDITGLTQADAELKLAEAGLIAAVTTETSTTVPAGLVISQDPSAGKKVDKGSAVSFVVSSGSPSPSPTTSPSPAGVAVPNVYGMDANAAAAQVSAEGLTVAFKQKGGTGQPPGTVVGMQPDAGTIVPSGSTVTLVIAK
jgi:serine/threonine-protein kinase